MSDHSLSWSIKTHDSCHERCWLLVSRLTTETSWRIDEHHTSHSIYLAHDAHASSDESHDTSSSFTRWHHGSWRPLDETPPGWRCSYRKWSCWRHRRAPCWSPASGRTWRTPTWVADDSLRCPSGPGCACYPTGGWTGPRRTRSPEPGGNMAGRSSDGRGAPPWPAACDSRGSCPSTDLAASRTTSDPEGYSQDDHDPGGSCLQWESQSCIVLASPGLLGNCSGWGYPWYRRLIIHKGEKKTFIRTK